MVDDPISACTMMHSDGSSGQAPQTVEGNRMEEAALVVAVEAAAKLADTKEAAAEEEAL